MKTNAIIRIILFSLTIVVLVSILLAGLGLSGLTLSFSDTSRTDETLLTGQSVSVDGSEIRNLSIEWVAGHITIVPGDDLEQITFWETTAENTSHPMQYKVSGSKLTIRYNKDSIFDFGIHFGTEESKDLYILVPQNWICDELKIEVAAANVDVQNMTIRNVDFDGASGTCNFADCVVGDLDIDTASGDVTFTGELDCLDFDAASASFSATLRNCPREIEMDGMSGDLDLTLPTGSGFTVSMDGLSSDFRCDFGYAQRGNGTYVSGDGSCRIDVDGMSCDVYIRQAS